MRSMNEFDIFSRCSILKVMKKYGADRASEEAKILMARLLERYAMKITKKANKFAVHANRQTIREEDIKAGLEK